MRRFALVAGVLLSAAFAQAQLKTTQVTSGGCCTDPFWSPDSRRVLFIDKPPGAASAGVFAVSAAAGGPQAPALALKQVAWYSPDLKYAQVPGDDISTVTRVSDGTRFTVPTDSVLRWSPEGKQVAWSEQSQVGNFDVRQTRVMVSTPGGRARVALTVYGGGVSGWLNEKEILVSGKSAPSDKDRALRAVNLSTGAGRVLARANNLRGVSVAPGGKYVVYYVAFDEPGKNGAFIVNTASGARKKLSLFGSYRWWSTSKLLLIPIEPGEASHRLVEVDAATGKAREVADLATKVSEDQWEVSPDGSRVVFLNARDRNLYVAQLRE